MPPHYCFRTLTHIFQQLMWSTQNEKTELLTQKNRLKRQLFKVFWSECGDSNPGPPAPKLIENTFSTRLWRFLALFNLFRLLFGALISAVSGCSSAVCGNLCGQKRFPPDFRCRVTDAGREAFCVSDRLHCNSEQAVMQVVSAWVTAQQLRRYRQRIGR